jgi:hypothetical protein
VEYLIHQSVQGNHVLFDLESLRRVFWKENFLLEVLSDEDAYAVEHHIEKLMTQPSLAQKRAYLDALDERTFHILVRTYFNIVENNIYETHEVCH